LVADAQAGAAGRLRGEREPEAVARRLDDGPDADSVDGAVDMVARLRSPDLVRVERDRHEQAVASGGGDRGDEALGRRGHQALQAARGIACQAPGSGGPSGTGRSPVDEEVGESGSPRKYRCEPEPTKKPKAALIPTIAMSSPAAASAPLKNQKYAGTGQTMLP